MTYCIDCMYYYYAPYGGELCLMTAHSRKDMVTGKNLWSASGCGFFRSNMLDDYTCGEEAKYFKPKIPRGKDPNKNFSRWWRI